MKNENEYLPREKMRALQEERFVALVKRLFEHVPFYRERIQGKGLSPSDIRSLDDLPRLPFTTKDDMRVVYPFGLLAVSLDEIEEIHASSGTTGKPVVAACTRNDLDIWGEVMGRTLAMGGATEKDVVQNAYGYGLFTGGMGAHYGASHIHATVIPISGGNTRRQLMLLEDFGSTVLCCTPSYALYLAESVREAGIDPKNLKLEKGFFGAEPWSDAMRVEIERNLAIKAYDIYGLTEIIGPGVASECTEQNGLHINEDHFYPEIIHPDTGEVLPDGEKGELVITTLTKTGTPLLRYRTRDITYLTRGVCPCGRSTVRMHRLFGRSDDMLIIRGVNVFPSQIEEVLLGFSMIEPHYQLIVDRKDNLDRLEVQIEMTEALFSDEVRNIESIEKKIESALASALLLHARVRLVEPKTIARSEGKAVRVVDKRIL
jgi:phenylacetate-CoA ligase